MSKKIKRTLKLAILCMLAGFMIHGNLNHTRTIFALEDSKLAKETYHFYRTTEEDLDIDSEGVLNGFSTGFSEKNVTLVIPESVTSIRSNAFAGKYDITTVELPTTLSTLEDNAFQAFFGAGAFENCNGIVEVYDPSGKISSDPDLTSRQYGSLLYYALSLRQKDMDTNITIDADGQVFCNSNRGQVAGNYFVGYLGSEPELVLAKKNYSYEIHQYALWENSIITSVDTTNSNAKTIGNYAFYECANLKSVILPESLTSIGFSAFQYSSALENVEFNCKNLNVIQNYAFDHTGLTKELVIPASVETIGENAFYNCSIDSLVFEEPASADALKDLTIHRNAFRNTRLTVVELPSRLKSIYLRAFLGTSLSTVYIHSDHVEYGAVPIGSEVNEYFPRTATIIYDTKEAYLAAKDAPYINTHANQMTYLIDVSFTDGNQEITYQGLAGRSFELVKGGDGVWTQVSSELKNALIPTQDGYAYSVWYDTEELTGSDYISNQTADLLQAGIDKISLILENALSDASIDSIHFYAKYIARPNITGSRKTYEENKSYNDTDDFISLLEAPGPQSFDKETMNILLEDGKESIANAGEYTLIIQLKEQYGAWQESVNVTVTIERKVVHLNDLISWSLDGNISLDSGNVFIYKNDADEFLYSQSYLSEEQAPGYSFYSLSTVTNSIVRSRNEIVEIQLNSDPRFDIYYFGSNFTFEGNSNEEVGQNSGQENNIYTAKAIIKANPNYSFRSLGSDQDTITNLSRGLTIDISEDRSEARISKVWYILDVSNSLRVKGSLYKVFTLTGWKYNTTASIDIPVMEHSSPTSSLTFTLYKDSLKVVEGVEVEASEGLTYFINDSMPAGNYELIIHIPDVVENGQSYFGYHATYNFVVELADFKEEWKEDAITKLKDVAWQYAEAGDEGIVQLYHHSDFGVSHDDTLNDHSIDDLLIWAVSPAELNPERKGYWKLAEADTYYSSRFSLLYNLARMQSNIYYTYDALESRNSAFSPRLVDDYTVYYQFTARNYQSLVDETDDIRRREYKFEVTIFDYLDIPKLTGEFIYNGLNIHPVIEANPYFTVSYEDEEYQSAGRHTITLQSVDPTHYRWKNSNNSVDTGKYIVQFEIKPADNTWLQNPNILSWEFAGFDPETNLVIAEARYGDGVVFSIATDEKGENKVEGLESFYAKDGKVFDEDILKLLRSLPASDSSSYYYLISTVEKTNNYNLLKSSTRFQVHKTQNTWEVTPNVMQWKFGSYDKTTNLILAQARIKDINNPAVFKITYDKEGKEVVQGLEGFTAVNGVVSDDIATILSNLKAETYYLFTSVEETDSYAALSPEPYAFSISMASNYWDVMPSITTWIKGKYNALDNAILAASHFGDEVRIVITVGGREDQVVYDSVNGINKLSEAKVGAYELFAYVEGTSDYSELSYSFTFRIFEAPGIPWWGILLIVIGVLALVALVLFILHQSGALQLLSGKIVIAMRTKATVDATIAAVRANKVAEEAKKSVALAKQKELAEARKKALAEYRSLPLEERAAVLDERAKENALRAEKFQKKANSMQVKADRMKQRANEKENTKDENESNQE